MFTRTDTGRSALIHQQNTPMTEWSIPHNLGYRPTVTVTTLGGVQVEVEVTHLSVNTLTVSFLVANSGTARLS
jgi:hypothetical protein